MVLGGGFGGSQRHAEQGVSPQPRLVGGTVQIDQGLVNEALLVGGQALEGVENLALDMGDGGLDPLAPITVSTIAQLHRLILAGRSPRGHNGPTQSAAAQPAIHLHRGIAARVKNFAGGNMGDMGHRYSVLLLAFRLGIVP